MSDYIERWYSDLRARRSISLARAVTVVGLRDAHLGPKLEYAQVELLIEPADDLTVDVRLEGLNDYQRLLLDEAVFGIIGVFMSLDTPLKAVRIVVLDATFDPINSCQIAFRRAGRTAAELALKAQHSTDSSKSS